jgi:GTP 3',8-cyclase
MLRISITDRCNYRCVYCMPEEGVPWVPKSHLLTFEEIKMVVQAASEIHGIRRFKLTGGEPTIRNGLLTLVEQLRSVNGVEDLSMTTNGQLLEGLARPLKDAGLNRVTVSVDSLDEEKFRQITRTGDLRAVLRGIEAAEAVGLRVKINCVTMRGVNDREVADFARLTLGRNITVRFIEYMPLGEAALMHAEAPAGPSVGCDNQNRGAEALVTETETRSAIEAELGPLVRVNRETEPGAGPASVWRLAGGNPRGRIGFISAMSAPFCATCNRLRLTADGLLRSCLFDGGEVDLKAILRYGHEPSLKAIANAMVDCVRLKPAVHSNHGDRQMSQVGG